jgi:hypothetical protein
VRSRVQDRIDGKTTEEDVSSYWMSGKKREDIGN